MENSQSANGAEKITRFNVTVQQIPYQVDISSFKFNNEKRYNVTINGGPRDIFAWDSEMEMYKGLDDPSAILPDGLMIEINKKLLALDK